MKAKTIVLTLALCFVAAAVCFADDAFTGTWKLNEAKSAIQKLHGNESLTIFLTDIVNRANILMIQSRRRLRLALEAGQCLRVSGDFFGQKLEGNEAMQPRVLGFIHHTHTAAPELLDDAVVRDGLADQLGWFHPMVGMLGMLIDASQGSRTVGFDGAISDLATSWTSWAGLDSAFRGW